MLLNSIIGSHQVIEVMHQQILTQRNQQDLTVCTLLVVVLDKEQLYMDIIMQVLTVSEGNQL